MVWKASGLKSGRFEKGMVWKVEGLNSEWFGNWTVLKVHGLKSARSGNCTVWKMDGTKRQKMKGFRKLAAQEPNINGHQIINVGSRFDWLRVK